jgi:hypothetical protein
MVSNKWLDKCFSLIGLVSRGILAGEALDKCLIVALRDGRGPIVKPSSSLKFSSAIKSP